MAILYEQNMSFPYAVKHYRAAVIWSTLMAATSILEGYEEGLVTNFLNYEPFSRLYCNSHHTRQLAGPAVDRGGDGTPGSSLSGRWQMIISMGTSLGEIAGLLLAPALTKTLGYRYSTLLALLMVALFAVVPFLSSFVGGSGLARRSVFAAGHLLLGVPWGLLQSMGVPYICDITPLKLRGPASTMTSAFLLFGHLASALVLRSAGELGLGPGAIPSALELDLWAVRLPLLLQYALLVVFAVSVPMLPESPLTYMHRGDDEKALSTLRRLNKDPRYDPQGSLDALRLVDDHGDDVPENPGFMACFGKANRWRTEITVGVYLMQQLGGMQLICLTADVLQEAGLTEGSSELAIAGMYLLCIGGAFVSIPILRAVGRRTAWMGGLWATLGCLAGVGTAGSFFSAQRMPYLGWISAGFLALLTITFTMIIGPIGYTIASEVPTSHLKGRTNSIAHVALAALTMVNITLAPYLLGEWPEGWGLETRSAFVWVVTTSACLG